MSEDGGPSESRQRPGEFTFTVILLLASVVLASLIGVETRAYKRLAMPTQPWFWPGVALGGMVLCSLALLFSRWRERGRSGQQGGELNEVAFVARSVEFMCWFMAYVWLTPWIGYLLSTVLFMVCLSWRAGYRNGRTLGIAAGLGAFIVVLFKAFLNVKIPGGAVYDLLPPSAANFMITNF